jgi:hypothetical protein
MQTSPVKFYKTVVSLPAILEPNTMYAVRVGEGFDFYLSDLTGSIAYKINIPSFTTLTVSGETSITASNTDTLELRSGPGIRIDTDATAGSKSITFTATGSAGSNAAPIKTFNILNDFSAPLIGNAIYVPSGSDTIRSLQLINGRPTSSDLMIGLYRNNDLLGFYTIPAGNIKNVYTGLSFQINSNDQLTVNVVAGSGTNFSMSMFNFDI